MLPNAPSCKMPKTVQINSVNSFLVSGTLSYYSFIIYKHIIWYWLFTIIWYLLLCILYIHDIAYPVPSYYNTSWHSQRVSTGIRVVSYLILQHLEHGWRCAIHWYCTRFTACSFVQKMEESIIDFVRPKFHDRPPGLRVRKWLCPTKILRPTDRSHSKRPPTIFTRKNYRP
jgi:hypothetical protein